MSGRRSYAVIGQPVAHSLSPRIHEQFAEQLGLPISYGLLEAEEAGFAEAVRGFFAAGGSGLNVTLPFKAQALELASHASGGARAAQAANTLKAEPGGSISACNTDGPGLLVDLQRRHAVQVRKAKVLLLGAGGAAAGVLGPLIAEQPESVVVANRSPWRAEQLVARFAQRAGTAGATLTACGLNGDLSGSYDLVLNATSAGHGQGCPQLTDGVWSEEPCAYDLSYGAAAEDFLQQAKEAGASRVLDGLGMLVEQAALSFAYWEGQMPDTDPVVAQLRAAS